MTSEDALRDQLGSGRMGVLATVKRDGRPQLSTVSYAPDPARIRISTFADSAKVRNLRRDPRAALHVSTPSGYGYTVAEGTGTVSAATTDPDDAINDELVDIYRAIAGEHPDWAEFRAAMVEEKRVVLRLTVVRLYGWATS